MSSEAPSGVGKTALGMAMIRAQESRRSDRLFDDPYAAAFLAAAPGVFDAEQRAAATGGAAVCRRVHHGHVGVHNASTSQWVRFSPISDEFSAHPPGCLA